MGTVLNIWLQVRLKLFLLITLLNGLLRQFGAQPAHAPGVSAKDTQIQIYLGLL